MESEQSYREELIAGISKQMKTIHDFSKRVIYVYLDDIH